MLVHHLVGALVAAAPLVTFESVLASARSGPAELRADAEIAEARRAVAEVAGRQRETPVVGVAAGPRRGGEGTEADVAVDLEVALLRRGGERRALVEALAGAEAAIRSAARAASRRQLLDLYIDAWAAGERVRLRERDAAVVERWLDLARRRVAAGADPPFEAEIVAAQRGSARLALAQARAEALAARHSLRALATVDESGELQEPALPAGPPQIVAGAPVAAVRARARLGRALLRLDEAREGSRWSLVSSLEREGDEEAAHVGFALRLPRRGEAAAIGAATLAEVSALEREAEAEAATLEARAASAATLLEELGDSSASVDFAAIFAALEARLVEGKDRPVEALPLRREILSQLEEALERRVAVHRAGAELAELTTEVTQ